MHVGPVAPIVSEDPEDQLQQDGNRLAEYTRWRAFARGEQWIEPRRGGPPRPMVFNYARTLIRKTASYVFPQPATFTIPHTDDDPEATAPAEKALAALISRLDLGTLDLELEVERSTIGDAAVKVTWDTDRKLPRVVSVDPATLSVAWSPDNPRQPMSVKQTYGLPGWALLPYGIDIKNDSANVAVSETWTAERWTMTVSGYEVSIDKPNPFGWIPYIVLPNDPHPRRFWGRSDLVDLADVAREFNRELSVLSQIMEVSGNPIAVLENVDGSDGIHTRPGAKWELPESSKAYLLDLLAGQGVRLHVDYLDQIRTTLHDIAETPRTAFGDTGRALSGAALEVEIQPLVQRVWRKRRGWDRFYTERNSRLLDLMARFGSGAGGAQIGPERITQTVWPPVLPSDDDANVRNQVQLVSSNIRSRYSAAAALGIADPAAELQQIITEIRTLSQAQPEDDGDEDGNTTEDTGEGGQRDTDDPGASESNSDNDDDEEDS